MILVIKPHLTDRKWYVFKKIYFLILVGSSFNITVKQFQKYYLDSRSQKQFLWSSVRQVHYLSAICHDNITKTNFHSNITKMVIKNDNLQFSLLKGVNTLHIWICNYCPIGKVPSELVCAGWERKVTPPHSKKGLVHRS